MNLTKYRCHAPVHAGRIEIAHAVQRGLSVSFRRLTVQDAGGQMRDVELRGNEITDYSPQPGDFYVVDLQGKRVVPKDEFELYYTRAT